MIQIFISLLWVFTAAHASSKLVLTGSSTIAPLMLEVAKAFEVKHRGVRIDVQTGGSSRGVTDARQGNANIGMVSRDLKVDESDLKGFTIARDGIGIILNKMNPVQKLTDEQIVGIYIGKITDWKQVGGVNAPITVVNKAEGRSTLELFLQYFKLKNSEIKASVIIGDNQQGIKTVAGSPNAIGYVSVGTAEAEIEMGTKIKLIPVNGIAASTENIKKGSFPISRNLLLVTKVEPQGLEKQLIDFARSNEVKKLVQDQFFVPNNL